MTCVFKTKEFCPRKVVIIGDPDFITVFSLSFELLVGIIITTLLVVIFVFMPHLNCQVTLLLRNIIIEA